MRHEGGEEDLFVFIDLRGAVTHSNQWLLDLPALCLSNDDLKLKAYAVPLDCFMRPFHSQECDFSSKALGHFAHSWLLVSHIY